MILITTQIFTDSDLLFMEAVMPLNEIRIVSLALNVPEPVAVAALQQKGASIIKVEPPEGDPLSKLCPL